MNTNGQVRSPRTFSLWASRCSLGDWFSRPLALAALALASALSAADRPADTPEDGSPPPDPRLVERWEASYRDGRRPGWDTGRPSTEVKRVFEQTLLRPGWVLELGCGTGV